MKKQSSLPKPKKSFGQNFLKDHSVVERIVEVAAPAENDIVIEIGPGTGILTEALAKKSGKVIAIELDRDLIPALLKKFPLFSNVSIVEGNILKLDLNKLMTYDQRLTTDRRRITNQESRDTENSQFNNLTIQPLQFKVVANIPYYITAPIIQYLLRLNPQPKEIILMIQKEVAERITAKPGDMSILAIAVQYYANAGILFRVPRSAFVPVPEVDSAMVKIIPHTSFNPEQDKLFFRLVKIGFASRRKTLLNNLSAGLHISKEETAKKLNRAKLNINVRAQELGIEDWKKLQSTLE